MTLYVGFTIWLIGLVMVGSTALDNVTQMFIGSIGLFLFAIGSTIIAIVAREEEENFMSGDITKRRRYDERE